MKLFVAFLVLCFLAGMVGRVDLRQPTASDTRARWFVAFLCVALAVGYYVFHRI